MKKSKTFIVLSVFCLVIVALFSIFNFRKEKNKMNEYLIEPHGYIAQDSYVVQAMVRESDGKLWYSCQNDDVGDTVMYYSTNNGQTWTMDTDFPGGNAIPDNTSSLRHSAITIDQNNVIYVVYSVYLTTGETEIYYTKRTSGSWSIPQKISTDSGIDLAWWGITICVESTGEVHAAWDIEEPLGVDNIMYNHTEGGIWQGEENLTLNGTYDSSGVHIRCDVDDNVHMVYEGEGYGTYPNKANIKYRKKTTGVWGDIVHVTDLDDDHCGYDMFPDDVNKVHLFYWVNNVACYQYYDGSWQNPEEITDGRFSFAGSTGSNKNELRLFYLIGATGSDIVYKKRLGVNSWSDPIVFQAGPNNARALVCGLFSYVPVVSGVHTNIATAGIAITKYVQTGGHFIYFMVSDDWTFESVEHPIVFYDTTRTKDGEEQPITFSDRVDVDPELPIVFYERTN